MKKSNSDTVRRAYMPPRTGVFCLSDDIHPLAASGGRFEDMESGGDLGGDSAGEGSFFDMGSGGDLGGDRENSGGFNDMDWGGDLGGTVIGD